jgi:hypothetical protein
MSSTHASRSNGSPTVTERITALLRVDDTGEGPFGVCGNFPHGARGTLTQFELDMRDWGLVYGMASAMIRAEDPWETIDSVAARALAPAMHAFRDVCDDFHERTELNAAQEVVAVFRQDSTEVMSELLRDRLDQLAEALPERD